MRSKPIPWPRSLRLQLVAAYVIALLLTVATGSAIMYGLLVVNDDAVVRKGLALQVRWIDEALRFDAAGKPFLLDGDPYHTWIYDSASDDVKYVLLDAAGTVLLGSGAVPQALAPPGHPFDPTRTQFHLATERVPVHVLTMPVQRNGATYFVQVARSDRVQDLTIRTVAKPVLRTTLYVALASLLVLALVVYVTLQRMLRPLRLASRTAAAVTPRNLSKRLDSAGLPTELAPL